MVTAGRNGTTVRRRGPRSTTSADLADAADGLALVVRQLGLTDADAHAALDVALGRPDVAEASTVDGVASL